MTMNKQTINKQAYLFLSAISLAVSVGSNSAEASTIEDSLPDSIGRPVSCAFSGRDYIPQDINVDEGTAWFVSGGQVTITGEAYLQLPHSLATNAILTYNAEENGFTAKLNGISHTIKQEYIRDLPTDLTTEKLTAFLQSGGYLALAQIGDDIGLTAKGRLLGGGKGKKKKCNVVCQIGHAAQEVAKDAVKVVIIADVTTLGTGVGTLVGQPALGGVAGAYVGYKIADKIK